MKKLLALALLVSSVANADAVTKGGLAIYGDGSDGACTLDGVSSCPGMSLSGSTYTTTRPVFLTTLVVNSGITLYSPKHAILATRKITVLSGGSINADGLPGDNLGNGGAAPAAGNANELRIGTSGGTGGFNSAGNGISGALAVSYNGSNAFSGGAGGGGGNGGGTGGTLSLNTNFPIPRSYWAVAAGITSGPIGAGTGGGGGFGDGALSGGGGGAGGNILYLGAPQFRISGHISANGGAGGDGQNVSTCGGGGGGGGGTVLLLYGYYSGTAATASGGAAGNGTGTAASAGGDGQVVTLVN